MANYHISMIRGDTLSFNLEFTGIDKDLDTACLTVKEYEDGDIIFQKYLGVNNGITKISNNLYVVRVAPEDTEDLVAKSYHFDLEISFIVDAQLNKSDVFTIMRGILEIEKDVTYEEERR